MPRPKGPALTVDGIIIDGDKILLVRRGREPFEGLYALPGGFVELGETTEQAVVREVLEETGVRTRVKRLFGVYSEPSRDPRGHTASVVYVLAPLTKRAKGGDDASEAKWLPLGELPSKLAFDHSRIISDFSSSSC